MYCRHIGISISDPIYLAVQQSMVVIFIWTFWCGVDVIVNVWQCVSIHQKTTLKAAYISRQIQIQSTLITAKMKPVTKLGIFSDPESTVDIVKPIQNM